MPRPRPRPAPCDCLECREPASVSSAPGLADAAARQDPPPKLLLVFADGFLQALRAESASLVHLDAHAREGSLGMLALREGPLGRGGAPSGTERLVELTQLFGLQASICWLPFFAMIPRCQAHATAVAAQSCVFVYKTHSCLVCMGVAGRGGTRGRGSDCRTSNSAELATKVGGVSSTFDRKLSAARGTQENCSAGSWTWQ